MIKTLIEKKTNNYRRILGDTIKQLEIKESQKRIF